jgi:hypothetical protein
MSTEEEQIILVADRFPKIYGDMQMRYARVMHPDDLKTLLTVMVKISLISWLGTQSKLFITIRLKQLT